MVIMNEKRERHYHTLTELAQAADLCAKTFIGRVKELLTDPEISEIRNLSKGRTHFVSATDINPALAGTFSFTG